MQGYVNGRFTSDKYAAKRLLFTSGTGLKKYGTIGSFWAKPVGELWEIIKIREKHIADGLYLPGVLEQVEKLYRLFGGDVPKARIERSLGWWAAATL